MSKHSTGPWVLQTIETNHNGYDWPTFAIRDSIANYCLAVVGEVDRATAEVNEANAKLISAAPDLLTALIELRQQILAHHKMNVKKDYSLMVAEAAASKAIRKAEGGGE